MARILLLSASPLSVAASHTHGRRVVTRTREDALTLGVEHSPLTDLPGVLPTEAALRTVLHRDLRIRSALYRTLIELQGLNPATRQQMLSLSPDLQALWANAQGHFLPQASEGEAREALLVAGFSTLQPHEASIIDRSAADHSVVILAHDFIQGCPAGQAVAAQLLAQGWTIEVDPGATASDIGERAASRFTGVSTSDVTDLRWIEASDIQEECRHALTTLRQDVMTGKAVMLVVPDFNQYVSVLQALAWEIDLDLDLPLERPMNSVRFGAWLSAVLEVLQGDWSFTKVQTVLNHAFATEYPSALRHTAEKLRPATRASWQAAGLPEWMSQWPPSASADAYATLTYDLLTGVEQAYLSDDDQRVGQFLIDSLDGWPADQEMDLHAFATGALQLLEEPLLPQDREGLPVRTPALAGGRYDHVWILGLNESVLPAPLMEPPLLDYFDRRELHHAGVPCRTALDDAQTRDADFCRVLAAARESLTLSSSHRQGKHQLLPSPYLERLGIQIPTPVAPRLQRKTSTSLSFKAVQASAAAEARRTQTVGPYHGATGRAFDLAGHTFSATQFTRFGQCPYRWYAQHVLGLHEQESSAAELLPHERGKYYHRVLELVGRAAIGAEDPRGHMLASLPAALEQAAKDQGLTRRTGWSRQQPEHARRIQRALEASDFIAAGSSITEVERAFDVQWRDLRVTGMIDRIDQGPEQQLVLTDYKTSSQRPKPYKDQDGNTSDVQLSLYLDIAAGLYPELHTPSGRYLSLTRADRRVLGQVQHNPDALNGLVTRLRQAAAAGTFPANPGRDGEHCTGCPYPPLCRQPGLDRGNLGEEAQNVD